MAINPLFLQEGKISSNGFVRVNPIVRPGDEFTSKNLPVARTDEFLALPLNLPEKTFVGPTGPPPGQVSPVSGLINITSDNPAIQNLVNEINRRITELKEMKVEGLTPEIQDAINQLNNLELDKNLALANARDAANKQDAGKLDETIKKVDETTSVQKDLLTELIEEERKARESLLASFTPNEKEKELKTKLNTLRTERQLLPLELRQEGISASGIQARQVEDERIRAIQEQNLLLELGLEQEARQFKSAVLEKQIGFIRDDLDLQFKIKDRLDKQEKDILEQARTLRKDSLSALSDILESFEGLAYEDLDVESQSQILDLAKQFNIPVNLLASAMKNAKLNQIYERAKKAEESVVDVRQKRQDTADLLAQVATYGNREEALADLNRFETSIKTRIGDDGFQKVRDEVDRLFPPPTEESKEKVEEGGGAFGAAFEAVKGFFESLFKR